MFYKSIIILCFTQVLLPLSSIRSIVIVCFLQGGDCGLIVWDFVKCKVFLQKIWHSESRTVSGSAVMKDSVAGFLSHYPSFPVVFWWVQQPCQCCLLVRNQVFTLFLFMHVCACVCVVLTEPFWYLLWNLPHVKIKWQQIRNVLGIKEKQKIDRL